MAYQQLSALGKICNYICYQGEGHTFIKTENQMSSKLAQLEFLDKYLTEQ
jgi:dipeptidyl aminopeptidase/acylaminoacyl peptidase